MTLTSFRMSSMNLLQHTLKTAVKLKLKKCEDIFLHVSLFKYECHTIHFLITQGWLIVT